MTDRSTHAPTDSMYSPEVCAHCGLTVPPALQTSPGQPSFCCAGCKAVFGMIRASGLDRFYELRAADLNRLPSPANPRLASYAEFDDASFEALHVRGQGLYRSVDWYLEGVHCSACVWLVERLPRVLPGVIESRLDLGRAVVSVTFDPNKVRLSQVAQTLDRLGYPPHPFRSQQHRELRRREERNMLVRLAVAGAAAGNVMLVAVALYAGAESDAQVGQFFRWASMLVAVPAVLWAGKPFFAGAINGLRAKTLHMDVPVSLALIGTIVSGVWNTVTGRGHVYFDSVTMLVFLLLTARWVQMRALRASSEASELLFSLAPSKARLVESDGSTREVPVEALVPGQTVEVLAGETLAADGVVVQGQSRLNVSLLTGETKPISVEQGSEVHAGAANISARLWVRVTASGEQTRVGRLLAAVREARSRRAPIVQVADRIASYFVAAVLALAGFCAVLWWHEGREVVVERVVAMLVVTCPCALGLATPLALSHALGLAARAGIFVKGADTIEALAHLRLVLLDKTGTITEGALKLLRFEGPAELQHKVAALESHSAHPLAKALVQSSPEAATRPVVEDVTEVAGAGIRGTVDGVPLVVGTASFLRAHGCELSARDEQQSDDIAASGATPVLVGEAGRVAAVAALGDPIRADSERSIARLKQLGLSVGILSGDHAQVVARVAQQVGIEPARAWGNVSPEDKHQRVEQLTREGVALAMVGDGANDAAALAAARVGIAVRGGAEVSLATADVFLTRPGLTPAVELIEGSRAALMVVYRNLGISLIYNLAGATLALVGLIHPLAAAILMPVSSLSVIVSSIASRPFRRVPSWHAEPAPQQREVPA